MAEIVRGYGQIYLDGWPVGPKDLEDLKRFSIRHASWTRAFIEQELRTARGEALQAIVRLRSQHEDELAQVYERGTDAAAPLLDFWPSEIGDWAAKTVILVFRSLSALRKKTLPAAAVAGLAIAAAHNATHLTRLAREKAQRLGGESRPGGSGVPEAVSVEPVSIVLSTDSTLANNPPDVNNPPTSRHSPR